MEITMSYSLKEIHEAFYQYSNGDEMEWSVFKDFLPEKKKKERSTPYGYREGTHKLRDHVYLTYKEGENFINEFGTQFFEKCIEKLDCYLENSEKMRRKYKNMWVIRAVKEDGIVPQPAKKNVHHTPQVEL